MKALVVYDSAHGNTARIAEAIAAGIGPDAHVYSIRTLAAADLPTVDLLVVGSPTQGGQPTEEMRNWLGAIGPKRLAGTKRWRSTRVFVPTPKVWRSACS